MNAETQMASEVTINFVQFWLADNRGTKHVPAALGHILGPYKA
jgi:hypothetical protein